MAVRESILINIKLHRMFIVQRLAENIAESLRRQYNYEVDRYYKICLGFLVEAGIERQYARDMMKDVVTDAYELYFNWQRTGEMCHHNASGCHPEFLIAKEVEDLVTLFTIFSEGLHKETAATTE